jgi:NitT/TauT family transport system permease protein
MPLVGVPTRRVRDALKQPIALGPDLFLLLLVGAVIGGMVMLGQRMAAPSHEGTDIALSLWSLPKYTLLSLGRGFAAYGLSLLFTLVYGTIAAHNQRAERFMIPALDVLQAIPVLGFLPGLVLALTALFPTREVGLELACIVMIFTGQVWNMTFSFHASVRSVPQSLREVAAVQRLNGWQVFRLLEAPAATIGLVWNSMMSMAGGWFFLTVTEAFTLGNRDFRLPGIGSYMNESIHRGDVTAMIGAVVAMVAMIVLVDQLFWRPLVAWSQRFKMEETAEADQPGSWVLDLLHRSRLYQRLVQGPKRPRNPVAVARPLAGPRSPSRVRAVMRAGWKVVRPAVRWVLLGSLAVGVAWGLWSLVRLLIALPLHDPVAHEDWITVLLALFASFLRTTAAVALGAAWALPVGVLVGLSARWSQRLQPVLQVVASFPAPMLFPLVTLLLAVLGIPFTVGCIILLLLGAQWYILFNVIAGARAIPDNLKEVAEAYGMSRLQRWTRLYIPCVFPYLVTGLITAAGGAWNATIVSEYVLVRGNTFAAFGLGSTISQATAAGHYPLLCASVVTMALCVVLINRLFWKRLYRLAEDRFSLNA